jgi:para-nitrobenzyl esterase
MAIQVTTNQGIVEGYEEEGLSIFKGIPFAAPPVGKNRWMPPQPCPAWDGVLDTTKFGNQAPQNDSMLDGIMGTPAEQPLRGEDCLYLNIWTPATDSKSRPVMVWIHGGGFTIGAGSQPIYDGQYLASEGDVVIVTVNYRMGALGFMNLNEITAGKIPAKGNEGLLDQIASLQWVKDNIAAFGGDASNVTIFGESAGGMSVGALLAMPKAKGLFHKAIPQSGACHTALPKTVGVQVAETVLGLLGVSADDRDALMNLDEALLTEVQPKLSAVAAEKGLPGMSFQPVIDGEDLPCLPIDAIQDGFAAGIPIMAGSILEEWKLFSALDPGAANMTEETLSESVGKHFGQATNKAVEAYRAFLADQDKPALPVDVATAITTDRVFRMPAIKLLEAQKNHTSSVYSYLFDWQSPLMNGAMGACHAVELGHVFGTYNKGGAEGFFGEGEAADKLSSITRMAWLNFAKTGNPGIEGWQAYDTATRSTMVLGDSSSVKSAPFDETRSLWDGEGGDEVGLL